MTLECEICGAKDRIFVVKQYDKNILVGREIFCDFHFSAKAFAVHKLCKMTHPEANKKIEKEADEMLQGNLESNDELKDFLKSNTSFDKPKEEDKSCH